MLKSFILSLLFLTRTLSVSYYQKVVHNTDPNAKCLDGTPPVLYFQEGGDLSKFLIFFIGGGICEGTSLQETLNSCLIRSQTILGSSTPWPETFEGQGYLSSNQSSNDLANYTKIVFGYCDGFLHQGVRNNPISFKGTNLFFRGATNTRSNFKWIMNKYPTFKNAQQVIVTGSSAGGIATFLWTNYVRDLISNSSNVISIIDSGIFLSFKTFTDHKNYSDTILETMFKISNTDQKTPLDLCNKKYEGQEFKCLIISNAWTSLQSRTLIVGSEYDSWVIENTLKINCLSNGTSQYSLAKCNKEQLAYIQSYRSNFQEFMSYYIQVSKNSAWTIGCSQHGYSFEAKFFNSDNERVPAKTGLTLKEAITAFAIKGQKVVSMESQPWPANNGCSK